MERQDPSPSPEERRIEAMVDGGGMTYAQARELFGENNESTTQETPVSSGTKKAHRHRTGNVRGFGDSGLRDGENPLNFSSEPITPEQRERNTKRIAEIRANLARLATQRDKPEA